MTKKKRNLFNELMEGVDAMRAHREQRRDICTEILDGLREIKRGEYGRIVIMSNAADKSRLE